MQKTKRFDSHQHNLRRCHAKNQKHGTPVSSELCQSPSVAKDPSLGTPGLSKLCPSPCDVKNLCFGTFDLKQLTPPAASSSSDGSRGTPSPDWPSPSGPLDLNKPRPSASCYDVDADVNADANPCEEDGIEYSFLEEEYTSEDVDHSAPAFEHPLQPSPYIYQDEVMRYKSSCDFMSPSVSLKVSEWAATWNELDVRPWTWIHVHAYYSKKKRHGGYGVIVCDAVGKPIIAKAYFSRTGVSFFHQLFKGLNAGVELAEGCECDGFHVGCNSRRFPLFFRSVNLCSDNKCRNTSDPKNLCNGCKRVFIVQRCDMVTAPLVQNLRQRELTLNVPSYRAEHYLVKMEKKKILEAGLKEDDGTVYFPDDFPQGLKNLVWLEHGAKKVRSHMMI